MNSKPLRGGLSLHGRKGTQSNVSAREFPSSISIKSHVPTGGGLFPFFPGELERRVAAMADVNGSCETYAVETASLPAVTLPGDGQRVIDTARKLGELLAPRREHLVRGGQVISIAPDANDVPILKLVEPIELISEFERVAVLVRHKRTPQGLIHQQTTCSQSEAATILACQDFLAELPRLKQFSRCPLLVESDGVLRTVVGYDDASGVLARGQSPVEMPLSVAVELLNELLADFQFPTDSDRSRALAAIITPALVMGGLLPGRAALDMGEADESQSGKGYRHKITAAIYGQIPTTVTQHKSGVGGMDEAFDAALIAGKSFISLDNVRGKVDSPKIESFLTEDSYLARCAHSKNIQIDPRRVCVMFTSNKADSHET